MNDKFNDLINLLKNGNATAKILLEQYYSKDKSEYDENYLLESIEWIKLWADKGDSTAQYNLAMLYENGVAVKKDLRYAKYYYEKSYALGNTTASVGIKRIAKKIDNSRAHESRPINEYFLFAENGDVYSQRCLGEAYQYGFEVEVDLEQSQKWYRMAAAADDTESQIALALLLTTNPNDLEKYKEGLKYAQIATEKGSALATTVLANSYEYGYIVEKNPKVAMEYHTLAAKLGSSTSKGVLAYHYYIGDRLNKNIEEAILLFKDAANDGDEFSQKSLGFIYANDKQLLNYDQSVKYYELSAKQGNLESQRILGLLYLNDTSDRKNYVKSLAWLDLAASNGDEESKSHIEQIKNKMPYDELKQAIEDAKILQNSIRS